MIPKHYKIFIFKPIQAAKIFSEYPFVFTENRIFSVFGEKTNVLNDDLRWLTFSGYTFNLFS